MELTEIAFYEYKIRMCVDNGIRMYLVSDLLRQYNEKHGTNKRFADYLQNKQTQELLRKRCEKTDRGNFHDQANGTQDDKFDIPDVIQYIKTTSFGGANKGYIVCEELLHACLMWADPDFAWDVFSFLTRLRQEDNNYLRKANQELNQENKNLKKRHVPNKEEQQWCYYLSYKVEGDTVYLYSQFCLMDRWDTACKTMKKMERSHIYSVNNLPNGYTFRCMANDPVRKICEKNGGSSERKYYNTIPLTVWNSKEKQILASFRL